MTDYLLSAPFLVFTVWTLLSVAFGVVVGRALDAADKRESADPPWVPDFDTDRIDWNDRPEAWL